MATAAPKPRAFNSERLFYLLMVAAILATVFVGFAPTFYLRGAVAPRVAILPLTPLIIIHGALFTGWVLLVTAQVSLVAIRRLDFHRRMGLVGLVMVTAMVVIGALVALDGVTRQSGRPGIAPLTWLAIPLLDMPVFAGLIGFALYKRRSPQTHKRLMLIAMIGLLAPSLGRMPWPEGTTLPVAIIGSLCVFLTPIVIRDIATLGKVHPATIGGSAWLIGSWFLRIAVWRSALWLAFAGWSASLVA